MRKLLALTALLFCFSSSAGTPIYAVTAAPSGSCSASSEGQRVQVVGSTGAQWCCVSSTWTACGAASVPDATATVTGGIRLTGDLGGTATSPSVVDNSHAHTGTTISALDGADLTTGTVAPARLGTGTPSSTTYLRGDSTWATISAGGGTPDPTASTTMARDASTRVAAGGFSVGIGASNDLTANAPWYGLGVTNINGGSGNLVQVAGWAGLTLKSGSHELQIPLGSLPHIDGRVIATSLTKTSDSCTTSTIRNGTQNVISTGIVPWGRIVEFRIVAYAAATGTGHHYMFNTSGLQCSAELWSGTGSKWFGVGNDFNPPSSAGPDVVIDVIRCKNTVEQAYTLEQLTEVAGSQVCAAAGTTVTLY